MDTSKKISAQRGRCLGYTVTCASVGESKVPPCEGLQSAPGLRELRIAVARIHSELENGQLRIGFEPAICCLRNRSAPAFVAAPVPTRQASATAS